MGLRVQAPFGARVLSFVCCAPNDGFGPQSGLVQRGVLYAAAWGSENHATALTGEENAIPLWWLAPPPCPVGSMSLDSRVAGLPYESSSFATPASGGTITRAYCRAIYEESVSRCFILPPLAGAVRRSRIGGSRVASQSAECLSCHMIQKGESVTLTL